MTDPREALGRLRRAAESGHLGEVCHRHNVTLLAAFGSAARLIEPARDLDLAVRFGSPEADILGLLDVLAAICGTNEIDIMNLERAGPVARERALVGAIPLFEERPGLFSRAQLAAMMERMDTAWLRRLDLELLAG